MACQKYHMVEQGALGYVPALQGCKECTSAQLLLCGLDALPY